MQFYTTVLHARSVCRNWSSSLCQIISLYNNNNKCTVYSSWRWWYILVAAESLSRWDRHMEKETLAPASREWSLLWQTSLSQTVGCWISFLVLMFWLFLSWLTFAVREPCTGETQPCWSFCPQQPSVTSFWRPYSELANNMLLTSSSKTEVGNTMNDYNYRTSEALCAIIVKNLNSLKRLIRTIVPASLHKNRKYQKGWYDLVAHRQITSRCACAVSRNLCIGGQK